MRLTRYTDFSFRVLFYLAVNQNRAVPISEIAEAYDVSQNHFVKVVHHLVKTGYLLSVRGRHGGVSLARPVTEISLGEVVRCTEPELRILDCMGCVIAEFCTLPHPMQEALNAFVEVLDKYTLDDIIKDSRGLEGFLYSQVS
ncbi:MAG: Rrf2 family transcriptional regulator [Gammaproteobacteria bacterium]|nr:Rrf2 family transcriptional regulator [Pseudomonadales bacterium]MCP5358863.1 Rrf2 family transcriptional regulator [Pseudomonadales bacterium]